MEKSSIKVENETTPFQDGRPQLEAPLSQHRSVPKHDHLNQTDVRKQGETSALLDARKPQARQQAASRHFHDNRYGSRFVYTYSHIEQPKTRPMQASASQFQSDSYVVHVPTHANTASRIDYNALAYKDDGVCSSLSLGFFFLFVGFATLVIVIAFLIIAAFQ